MDDVTSHHYIAQAQSAYLKHLKETLPPYSHAIVLLDFSENYSFVCQDAVQGFHWDTAQATVHPFVVYYRKETDDYSTELVCLSLCVISDEQEHTASTVHAFVAVIVKYLLSLLPHLKHLYYFSEILSIYVIISRISILMQTGAFSQPHMGKALVMA